MDLISFQKQKWRNFIKHDIYDVLKESRYKDENVIIEYELDKTKSGLINNNFMECLRAKKSYAYELHCIINVKTQTTISLLNTISLPIIQIPYLTDEGFIVDGIKRTFVNTIKLANGWYLEENINKEKEVAYVKASLRTARGSSISIEQTDRDIILKATNNNGKAISIPIIKFAIALTEMDIDTLHNAVGRDLGSFAQLRSNYDIDDLDVDSCIKYLYSKCYNIDIENITVSRAQMLDALKFKFYAGVDLGLDGQRRFREFMSFSKRCLGLKLAEGVTLTNGRVIHSGDVLNTSVLAEIDEDESITSLIVYDRYNEKSHEVKKYEYTPNMCTKMLLNVLNAYFCYLDGVGNLDTKDALRSKVVETFSSKIGTAIRKRLNEYSALIAKSVNKDIEFNIKNIDFRKFNPEFYIAELKMDKFFQSADDTNTLSLVCGGYKVNSDVDASSASVQMRDIKHDQYGRICPLDTSERKEVGMNVTLSVSAGVDEAGFLTTPYYKVVNGVKTNELVHATAYDELGKAIAFWDETFEKDKIEARLDGKRIIVPKENVAYVESSYLQTLGYATSMVPGLEHQKSKRGTMAVKMANQGVPICGGERPLHSTGFFTKDAGVLRVSHFVDEIIEQDDLDEIRDELIEAGIEITGFDNEIGMRIVHFKSLHPKATRAYKKPILYLQGSMSNTLKTYQLRKKNSYVYKGEEIVFHKNDIDVSKHDFRFSNKEMLNGVFNKDSDFALGLNLKVLYKCYRGYTYEDAFVVRRGLVESQRMSSVKVKSYIEELKCTDEIFDSLAVTSATRKFEYDASGLPKKGTFIKGGDTLAVIERKIFKKVRDKNGTFKPTKDVEKTISIPIKSDIGDDGYVISASYKDNRIVIMTATMQDLHVGDKLAGRHGNKGVIGKIVDDLDMPFSENGEIIDVLINPLGVLGRGNPGQLEDAIAGLLGYLNNCVYITPTYAKNNYDFIMEEAEKIGLEPQWFYDGITGMKYPRKAYMGVLYIQKLNHLVEGKFIGIDSNYKNINAETLQPKEGKRDRGGQRLSEFCNWSIIGAGGVGALQDFQSTQCTDLSTRRRMQKLLKSGEDKPDLQGDNLSFMKMTAYFKALGVNIVSDPSKGYSFEPITDDYIVRNSTLLEIPPMANIYRLLHDPSIFPSSRGSNDLEFISKTSRRIWGHINFNTKLIMPYFLTSSSFLNHFYIRRETVDSKGERKSSIERLTTQKVRDLLEGKVCIVQQALTLYNKNEVPDIYADKTTTGMYALNEYIVNYSKEKLQELGIDTTLLYYSKEEEENAKKIGNIYSRGLKEPTKTDIKMGKVGRVDNDFKINYRYQKYRTKTFYLDPKNYTVTKMLILPEPYRPEQRMQGDYHHFDKMYHNLINRIEPVYSEVDFNTMYKYLMALQENVKKNDKGKKNTSLISIGARLLSSDLDKTSTVFRGELHGFRVADSGRSVIVGDPKLSVYEFGMPYAMALQEYRYQLIGYLRKTKNPYYELFEESNIPKVLDALAGQNIKGLAKYFRYGVTQDLTPREILELCYEVDENIFNALAERIKHEKNLINREPSLHRFSVKALTPILVRDLAMHLPPIHCPAFNADYDGDTMLSATVHSKQGQRSLAEGMSIKNNIINPKDNSIILNQAQDIILGLYMLTAYKDNAKTFDRWSEKPKYFYDSVDALEYDLQLGYVKTYDLICIMVNNRQYLNTVGRIVFNSKLPGGFTDEIEKGKFYRLAYDKHVTKKVMSNINADLVKKVDEETFLQCIDDVKDLGIYWSDFSGFTISMFDFQFKKEAVETIKSKAEEDEQKIREYTNLLLMPQEENSPAIINLWSEAIAKIEDAVTYPLNRYEEEFTDLYDIIKSNRNSFENLIRNILSKSTPTLTTKDLYEIYAQAKGKSNEEVNQATQATQSSVTGLEQVIKTLNNKMLELGDIPLEDKANALMETLTFSALRLREGISRDSALFRLIDSGARGNFANYTQCVGIVGQVSTSTNTLLESPLKGSYITGMDIFESFNDSFFARKGIISSAILTQDSGTLTKELITLCQDVVVEKEDCGADAFVLRCEYEALTDECKSRIVELISQKKVTNITNCSDVSLIDQFIGEDTFIALAKSPAKEIQIGDEIIKLNKVLVQEQRELIKGRVFQLPAQKDIEKYNLQGDLPILQEIGNIVNKYIDECVIEVIEKNSLNYISFRSTLECRCKKGVCQTCYGDFKGLPHPPAIGEFIGIISAQALGEPSAQLTLDTNHGKANDTGVTGGVMLLMKYVNASLENNKDSKYIYSLTNTLYNGFSKLGIDSHLKLKNEFYIKNIDYSKNSLQSIEKRIEHRKNKYINKFNPLTNSYRFQDLMLLDYNAGRFRLLQDYYSIFRSKAVFVNPRNFEIITRQQTRFWLITETIADLPESSVVTYDMLEERNIVPNVFGQGELYAYPLWCSYEEASKYGGNALTYISSSRVKEHIVDCITNYVVDDGKSVLSAQTMGANLVTRKIKNLKEYEPLAENIEDPAIENEISESEELVESINMEINNQIFNELENNSNKIETIDTSEFGNISFGMHSEMDDEDFDDEEDAQINDDNEQSEITEQKLDIQTGLSRIGADEDDDNDEGERLGEVAVTR